MENFFGLSGVRNEPVKNVDRRVRARRITAERGTLASSVAGGLSHFGTGVEPAGRRVPRRKLRRDLEVAVRGLGSRVARVTERWFEIYLEFYKAKT